MHAEYDDSIPDSSKAGIKKAIAKFFIEPPANALFFRVMTFTGRLQSNPPITSTVYEVTCIGLGGTKVNQPRVVVFETDSGWVAIAPKVLA